MIRLVLLAALTGLTMNLPLPDAKIYFPDESIPADPRSNFSQHPVQTEQRTYYTKSSHRQSGGHQSPIQWSPDDESGIPYGNAGHRVSYSTYGHPHRLSHSSHSYGAGGSGHQTYPHDAHHYQVHSPSDGGYSYSSNSGSDGRIEQISHGSSHGRSVEGHIQHTQQEVAESSGSHKNEAQWQESGHHVSHGIQTQRVEETGYNGRNTESQSEHTAANRQDDSGRPAADPSHGQHAVQVEQETKDEEIKRPSAADIAAEEHHIIQEIEELAGMTSSPEGNTKNPITQQQEIIREIKGLRDPNQNATSTGKTDIRQVHEVEAGSSHVNHETTIPPVRHYGRNPEKPQVHQREEVVETPVVKVTSDHGTQGAAHHVIRTEVREETHHQAGSSNRKPTPDPLDLLNLYNDYAHGDFKPGKPQETNEQPKKELKPEIKQAIDNIMRDWEVLPEMEGKPQPPPRKYKITKHVKVTTTTHNHPVVVHPSQTITKTVQTHSFRPSTSYQRRVTHHINIAELLEQLRQLESSPHHRNVTWCEEKIKEFLTELNRKEESGIEINQSVQEETLHHILTQDHTITKEIRHEVGHDAVGAVEEEPFVKKTVIELGQNEPTRPPTYWTEQSIENETHSVAGDNPQETGKINVDEQENNEPREVDYKTSDESQKVQDESQIFTVTPSPHHVPPLEALSHQSHTSSETKEAVSQENETSPEAEVHGSESEDRTTAPQRQSEIEEFRGEAERHDRPLPPNYKPQHNPEDEGENVAEESSHKRIDDLSIELPSNDFSHDEEHKSIENLNIDLPAYDRETSSKEDVQTVLEKEQAAPVSPKVSAVDTAEAEIERENHANEVGKDEEQRNEGPTNGQQEEHVVHELNEEHSGDDTKYAVESDHQLPAGDQGHSNMVGNEKEEEKTIESHSEGNSGGGRQTEYGKETIEDHNSGGSQAHSGSVNTQYNEETIHHSSGGSHGHSGGRSQTEYVEETVEHHNSAGSHEINYDQLIEELISLESLPGHQAIDKCEEKIRHFLEVLRKQQERGFDQNKAELERLRHLLEEIQIQKQNQTENGVNPHSPETSTSFWKKIGRKIKTTFEKAKTKAHDTVNGMMN